MPRKASKNSPRNYFTQETQQYIVDYNNSTDPVEREKIFTEHLYYPFYKLAECIIHSFKFYHIDVDKVEDLKLDIVRMIWQEKINLFDSSRGTKAYSYFGTIIKRWLIAYCNSNYAAEKSKVSAELCENYLTESFDEIPVDEVIPLSTFLSNWLEKMSKQIPTLFEKEQDQHVANACLTVIGNVNNLKEIGKKSFYVYVREVAGCDQPYITKVIKVLKASFQEELHKLEKDGYCLDTTCF